MHSLLDHGLPLALALSDGEAVDLGLDLCPPLTHVVLDVEHEGVLAEVGVHHLPWSLKAHRRVQVRLRQREIREDRIRMRERNLDNKSKQETLRGKTGKQKISGNKLLCTIIPQCSILQSQIIAG